MVVKPLTFSARSLVPLNMLATLGLFLPLGEQENIDHAVKTSSLFRILMGSVYLALISFAWQAFILIF